jgi:hypothetical protein
MDKQVYVKEKQQPYMGMGGVQTTTEQTLLRG